MFIYDLLRNLYPKMLRKLSMGLNWFWARNETQIPWYLVSRLRKIVEIRNCYVYIFICNLLNFITQLITNFIWGNDNLDNMTGESWFNLALMFSRQKHISDGMIASLNCLYTLYQKIIYYIAENWFLARCNFTQNLKFLISRLRRIAWGPKSFLFSSKEPLLLCLFRTCH